MKPKALVLGAGGFIGHHMVRRLKRDGFWVRGVDRKAPRYSPSGADDFITGDLRDRALVAQAFDTRFDDVYQFAAEMGGAGYLFTGANDAEVMHSSALINLNVTDAARATQPGRLLFSSSACIYPARNQLDPDHPDCAESTAYPADPDSEYGWEKLFAERLYLAAARNHGLNVRIARLHNVFGPEGSWNDGREKAPAALCRKVAQAPEGGTVEIWGDGYQTRSFLFIDEAIDGFLRLMASDCREPVNIGSDEMVTINDLARRILSIAGKSASLVHIDGPTGVKGRCSDNRLIEARLGWKPGASLNEGLVPTYRWISTQVAALKDAGALKTQDA
ncbi:MAG: NAD-dependent epimerase/dehydratase family protein [Pseudomonadota bacterium]